MVDIIVTGVLLVISGGAVWQIRRAKKRGEYCIGCPHSKQCNGKCSK